MMTNAQVIQRVADVLGASKTEAELLDKALRLIAAYDDELRNADRKVVLLQDALRARREAEEDRNGTSPTDLD
jgi:hypothetical protein